MTVETGKRAPSFRLPNQDGTVRTNEDYLGKWLVLYFYPKDNTPGCTQEAKEFSQLLDQFAHLGATVVGVSPDSTAAHQKFIAKHGLTVELLSDPDKEALQAFGVWQKKKMAGREYMGVVRTTFLIDPQGTVVAVWEKVKVKGHCQAVYDEVNARAGK